MLLKACLRTRSVTLTRTPCRYNSDFPKLGPPEVSHILRKNEIYTELNDDLVKDFALNQLPANDPIEDRLVVSRNRLSRGITFGVFDGHGGSRMAQVISQRLPHYIALSVLPRDLLESYIRCNPKPSLVERIFSVDQLPAWQYEFHTASLQAYAETLLTSTERMTVSECLCHSFEYLDAEVSRELQQQPVEEAVTLATEGCVASVAHIDGKHLYVASTGDCRAVLGIQDESGRWVARDMNKEHGCDNVEELQRILGEHPKSEANQIIQGGRLLGNLAPFRAFGDFTFKWPAEQIKNLMVPVYGPRILPKHYKTPPYLTARPEVTHHILSPRDRFMVVATDGVWEMLNSHKVVQLIGQFMQGRQAQDLFRLPKKNIRLGEINQLVQRRKLIISQKPEDSNAATHIIRNALGTTDYGLEHTKLAAYLGLPAKIARSYRDDMSLFVIFFESQKLNEFHDDN